jgi:hypothetical protein
MSGWSGHLHGFGPWVGPPERYHQEGDRRPPYPDPPAPGSPHEKRYREAEAEFYTSGLPPMMSGHWLMKRGQASAERTWTDPLEAVEWLTKQYQENPPHQDTRGTDLHQPGRQTAAGGGPAEPRHGCDLGPLHTLGQHPVRLDRLLPHHPPPRTDMPTGLLAPMTSGDGEHAPSPQPDPTSTSPRQLAGGCVRPETASELWKRRYGRFRAITIRWTWFVPS